MKSCLLLLSVVFVFSACERHSAEETSALHEEHGAGHNSPQELKKEIEKNSIKTQH